jgi:hypothetical protein
MQRTKKTRGAKHFQLKSGNTTPYPFLRGLKNVATGMFGALKNQGSGGGGGSENSIGARLERIEQKLDQGGGGSGATTFGGNNVDPVGLAAGKAKKAAQGDEEILEQEV